MPALADGVQGLSGIPVLVLGDAILDGYLEGESTRLTPDGPAPVVDVREHVDVPGGAANTAANVAALGGHALLLSVVGDDTAGRTLRRGLSDAGVDTRLNLSGSRTTLTKRRVVADGEILVRFDEGDVWPVPAANEAWLLDQLSVAWPRAAAVIVSDYGYGVMTPAVRAELRRLQQTDARLLTVDARDPADYVDVGPAVATFTYRDALRLVGALENGGRRDELLEGHGPGLLAASGAGLVAVTLGDEGAFFVEADGPAYRTYAQAVPARDSSGAGDTFAAALTLALAAGAQTATAAELASAATAVVVSKRRTAVCTPAELRLRLSPLEKLVTDLRRLAAELDDRRGHGRRVVFTSGSFDVLHRGHVALLNQAKAAGDVLVVGLRTDEAVRRLKGDGRPVATLDDRAGVLSGLSCVDAVVTFTEDTPEDVIRALRPDVVVKAGDPTEDRLPEADAEAARDVGAEVRFVPVLRDLPAAGPAERVRSARPPVRESGGAP